MEYIADLFSKNQPISLQSKIKITVIKASCLITVIF